MTDQNFTLFDTPLGPCGIVWTARGIAGVQLPERDDASARKRMARRHPQARESAPPENVQRVIGGIVALLSGDVADFSDVVIDDDGVPDFDRKVHAIARTIPAGKTMTYGAIAERLGDKLLARDVGQALGHNRTPLIVPCHRVLAADGKPGGFSATGGVATKMRLLSIEGAQPGGATLFDHLPLSARPR
jgi:methylated-DNA-[protein]-cysteine S-methyltransferase